jgi:hypothetical protein
MLLVLILTATTAADWGNEWWGRQLGCPAASSFGGCGVPTPCSHADGAAPQVGFFDIVALPLFQSFAQAFPDATPMLEAVKDNYAMWREEQAMYNSVATGTSRSSK